MAQTSRISLRHVLLASGLAVTLAFLGAALWMRFGPSAPPTQAAAPTITPPGGPFRLMDEQGRMVTDRDFGGQYRLMTFGFTNCPHLCPLQLQVIENALNQLPSDLQLRVISLFVSVDPARDTPERLKEYLSHFHPRQKGLTGTAEQIAEIAKAYKIHYHKPTGNQAADEEADMLHTAIVYLFAPDGHLLTFFPPHVTPELMARTITALIRDHRA